MENIVAHRIVTVFCPNCETPYVTHKEGKGHANLHLDFLTIGWKADGTPLIRGRCRRCNCTQDIPDPFYFLESLMSKTEQG